VTFQSTNGEMLEPEKPKKKRGRPKGWRKVPNMEKPNLLAETATGTDEVATETEQQEGPDGAEKAKKPRRHTSSSKDEDQWSVRIRSSIEKELQDSIAKGAILGIS